MDQAQIEKLYQEMEMMLTGGIIKFWQRHKEMKGQEVLQIFRAVVERESRRD